MSTHKAKTLEEKQQHKTMNNQPLIRQHGSINIIKTTAEIVRSQ